MSEQECPDTRLAVESAIANALAESDEMVTRWVALIESVDTDGKRGLFLLSNEDAKAWENIGMLGYALQCEQSRSVGIQLRDGA
jgi:hypothetical protein